VRSSTRRFADEGGRSWVVTKISFGSFKVEPKPTGLKLHEVARSCARKLGLTAVPNGTPLEFVNEHSRLWNAIWKHGEDVSEEQVTNGEREI
jgi:hypothetical protein